MRPIFLPSIKMKMNRRGMVHQTLACVAPLLPSARPMFAALSDYAFTSLSRRHGWRWVARVPSSSAWGNWASPITTDAPAFR
jgi:hypothetical protein